MSSTTIKDQSSHNQVSSTVSHKDMKKSKVKTEMDDFPGVYQWRIVYTEIHVSAVAQGSGSRLREPGFESCAAV